MKSTTFTAIALAMVAATAAPAFAQDGALTREQVRAELAEAIRTGNIVGDGQTGQKLNEMFPGSYPAQAVVAQGKSRADVKAELAEAVRSGDMLADGETGQKLNQLFPNRYPAKSMN